MREVYQEQLGDLAEELASMSTMVGTAMERATKALLEADLTLAEQVIEEDVHVVGLSVLSGSHLQVVPAVLEGLKAAGLDDVPVVVGGIVPTADAARLREVGVARVFTPKDFEITDVLSEIVDAIEAARA